MSCLSASVSAKALRNAASLSGGTPVHYLCDEANCWNPDIADLESKITDRTKVIVVINPNNPTGAVYTRETLTAIADLARQHNIPHQLEILPRGGTDAASMQRARSGAPAITLSIPTRYVHTANETSSKADIAATIDLLARFIEDAGSRSYAYEV